MRVLVTGGKGDLGRRLVERLEKADHDVLVGTRNPTANSEVRFALASEPHPAALANVDVVAHLATDPSRPDVEVDGSSRLWDAAREAGVGHVIYISIVGIDHHPFPYYRAKRQVERDLEDSGLPHTILRATQFHSFIPRLVDEIGGRLGVVPVPAGVSVQPIDADVVADRLAELVAAAPSGRIADLAGPDVLSLDDMVREYLRARKLRRLRVRMPLRGPVIEAFRQGHHLAPEAAVEGRTYSEHLATMSARRSDPVAGPMRLIAGVLFATMGWMLISPLGFHSLIAGFGSRTHTSSGIPPRSSSRWR